MRYFAAATVFTLMACGLAMADDFAAANIKYDSTTGELAFVKSPKGKKGLGAVPSSTTAASNVRVYYAKFDLDLKKIVPDDPVEGRLKNNLFRGEQGATGIITIAEDGENNGKVTQVLVLKGKKKSVQPKNN